jgi:hypothetical protein
MSNIRNRTVLYTTASGERIKLSEQNTFISKIANAVYNDIFESAREIDPSLKIDVFLEEFVGDCSDDFIPSSPRLEFTSSPKVAEVVAHIPKTLDNVIRIHDALRRKIAVNAGEVTTILQYALELDPNLKNAPILQGEEIVQINCKTPGEVIEISEPAYVDPEKVYKYFETHSPEIYTIAEESRKTSDDWGKFVFALRNTLRDEIEQRKQAKEQKSKRKRSLLPAKIPHYTFQEGRNSAIAIADPGGWVEVTGEMALMHAKEGDPIQTKLTAGANLDWWDMPASYNNLRDELRTLGVNGVYCFYVAMGMVLQERHITFGLDDLMKVVGWTPQNTRDREEKRRTLYRWLTLFDNLSVHGNRRRVYTDTLNKSIDTTIQSKLFMISELEFPEQSEQQIRLDGSQAPVTVTLTCGPWLERFRGNDKVLEYFGNILKLSGLPTGQAHGEWALSIGMALNQLWRERAYKGAEVNRTGDNNQEVIIYKKPFTRAGLLSMFPPTKFKVDEILKSTDPKRAQNYWDDAIALLTEKTKQTIETKKQISYYKELTGKPLPRQGWQDIWLNQHEFDIRPTGEARADAVEICKTKPQRDAAARRKAAKKKK